MAAGDHEEETVPDDAKVAELKRKAAEARAAGDKKKAEVLDKELAKAQGS